MKIHRSHTPQDLTFTLTREPVSEHEQAIFRNDLERQGLDETVWLILNGTARTGTKYSIPKVLRAYRRGSVVGVAYIMECRSTGKSLFANKALAALVNSTPFPMFCWIRNDAMVDSLANPGFVADGLTRTRFCEGAIDYLRRKYLYGITIDSESAAGSPDSARSPFCDSGLIALDSFASWEDAFHKSKHLKKQFNKFRNKGGTVEVLRGALSPDLRSAFERCMFSLRPFISTPFQDNYLAMAMTACSHDSDHIVHFIARLNGEVVGYQSFALSGRRLYCLSGAFDRTRPSNFHAYENVVLESIRFGLEQGLTCIHYGPVLNPTKARLMNTFVRCEQRYHTRLWPVQALLPRVIGATQLSPKHLSPYVGLSSSLHTSSV